MFAITACVWSWGSRLRETSWRKVAITAFWSPVRTMRPLSASIVLVSTTFFSIQASVLRTAASWAATMRSSPPIRAAMDTDLGAEKVTSRPGRWSIVPSPSLRPSRRPEPSGTSPARMSLKTSGSTDPESPRASAPLPAQALASLCAGSSFA